jgi:hypothetical protein
VAEQLTLTLADPDVAKGRAASEFTATEARCAVHLQRLWRERVRQGRQGVLQPAFARTRGASAAVAVQSAARGRQARRAVSERGAHGAELEDRP